MKAIINDHLRRSHNGYQALVQSTQANFTIQGGVCALSGGAVVTVPLGSPSTPIHDGVVIHFVSNSAQAHVINAGTSIIKGNVDLSTTYTSVTFGGHSGDSLTLVAVSGFWLKISQNGTHTFTP